MAVAPPVRCGTRRRTSREIRDALLTARGRCRRVARAAIKTVGVLRSRRADTRSGPAYPVTKCGLECRTRLADARAHRSQCQLEPRPLQSLERCSVHHRTIRCVWAAHDG